MDPLLFLLTEGKPYILAGGLVITEDGAWVYGEIVFLGEIEGRSNGTSTAVATLSQIHELSAETSGGTSIASQAVAGNGTAGYEIPYLIGLGGTTVIPLLTVVAGNASITGNLSQINSLAATITGVTTITGALTVTGSQVLSGTSNGVGLLQGELYVNAIRELAGTIAGSSSIIVTITNLTGVGEVDSASIMHLYFFTNVGVGFDPTDIYTGPGNLDVQNFPDGHTRDDFWEYLYIYINVGAGFDPTDDASDRPDFVDQTFPDGHTAFDFHEYLYLYLNVVRGFQQHGQLVIRPGYTRGPILPGAHPPKNMPQ